MHRKKQKNKHTNLFWEVEVSFFISLVTFLFNELFLTYLVISITILFGKLLMSSCHKAVQVMDS